MYSQLTSKRGVCVWCLQSTLQNSWLRLLQLWKFLRINTIMLVELSLCCNRILKQGLDHSPLNSEMNSRSPSCGHSSWDRPLPAVRRRHQCRACIFGGSRPLPQHFSSVGVSFSRPFLLPGHLLFLAEENLEAKKKQPRNRFARTVFEGSFLDFPCAGGLVWAAAQKDPFVSV